MVTRAQSAAPPVLVLRKVETGGLSLQEVRYADGSRMAPHAHSELSISLILRGALEESVEYGVGHRQAGAFSVGIKPFDIKHSDRFGPGCTHIACLKIHDSERTLLEDRRHVFDRWQWVAGGPATPVFIELVQQLRNHQSGAATWLELAAVDLLGSLTDDQRLRVASPPPSWLRRVRERVIEECERGVQTRALADEANIHAVSLARSFRRHFGESISQCVRRARLQTATRLLQQGDMPLCDIAQRIGLADQSQLSRLCRREAGAPPARLRRLQGSVSIVQDDTRTAR